MEKGQLLIELLVAMGIFAITVSVVLFLILDGYLADRIGRENTIATFLAKEGIVAAQTIRDNDWDDLTLGEHGLKISSGTWIFYGTGDDLSEYLREGERKIIVERIDDDRRKVTSKVSWKLTNLRPREVSLVSYLTNWQKKGPYGECSGTATPCSAFGDSETCNTQDGCSWSFFGCSGTATPCENFETELDCLSQSGCNWEKY